MSEKEKQTPEEEVLLEGEVQETPAPEEEEKNSLQAELDALKQTSAQQKEQFLRLAAEYMTVMTSAYLPPPYRQGKGEHLGGREGGDGPEILAGVRQPGTRPQAGDR